MPYLRCEACSAKALPIASRCPSCEVPFPEVRPEGYRPCRACDSLIDPTGESCRWCDAPVGQGPSRPVLLGAGVGILVLAIAGGAFIVGGSPAAPPPSESIAQSSDANFTPAPGVTDPASDLAPSDPVIPDVESTVGAGESTAAEGTDSAAPENAGPADSRPTDEADPPPQGEQGPQATDGSSTSGWVRAVATTFVNIRSAPGSHSEVQGIVPQDSEVLLGSANGDWREVRSGDLTGWAWEPLFALSTEGP